VPIELAAERPNLFLFAKTYDSSKPKLDSLALGLQTGEPEGLLHQLVVNDDIGVVSIAVRVGAPVSPVCRRRLRAAAALRIFNAWVRGSLSECAADRGIIESRHSRRMVPITRSQIAFAIGLRGGDFNTSTPSPNCPKKGIDFRQAAARW
jgi:hypothetical protein